MKVLFINFNISSTPGINNGLAILSAVLKEKGHHVKLIFLCEELGYGFDLKRVRQDILDFNPEIVGISLMETQLKYAADFCDDIREYYKGFVICGGPYPTMDPEGCFSLKGIDAVCLGEGEDALTELVEALEAGKDYQKIRNLWLKLSDGTIVKNKLRPFKDLNELPAEDRELFDLEKILPVKNYQLEVMLGRGCPYQCTYCINQSYIKQYQRLCEKTVTVKDYIRIKDAGMAVGEIKETVARHPKIKKVAFIDDNFLSYDNFLETFCKAYRTEVGLPFMCNVNPVSYNASKARLLKDSGCDDIRFGLESGSERIKRDILKRPVSNRSVIDAFNINKEMGMMMSSFNMIGLPTESKEEVLETLKLNAAVMPDTVKVMTFYPFKNTPIYDLCEQMDLIDYDKKYELDNYDTFTCLKFSPEHRLFLTKVQTAFNWYINKFLGNEASAEYARMAEEIDRMSEEEWERFDFYASDEEVSKRMRKKGVLHYSKFVNRSLAVKFPSKHFN